MNKQVFLALSISLIVNVCLSATVKCFYPPKNWQVCVDVNDFEPDDDYMIEKTILSGASGDMKITILTEKAVDGKAASERNLYGKRSADSFGIKETVKEFECGQTSCISFAWRHTSDTSPSKDRWSYHGYVVKEGVSFDIHISANITKHQPDEIINIIKSFKAEPTKEIRDMNDLFKRAYEPYNDSKDETSQSKQRIEMIRAFLKKYPDNAAAHIILAEHYMLNKEYELGIQHYLSALKYRASKIVTTPESLWACYDGLGLCYAATGEVPKSKSWFDAGYNLAIKTEKKNNIASSAYNLACYYSETDDIQKSLKYLSEAIELSKDCRQQAIKDSSFSKIKNDPQFIKLVKPE
jgi:hypothetical protein